MSLSKALINAVVRCAGQDQWARYSEDWSIHQNKRMKSWLACWDRPLHWQNAPPSMSNNRSLYDWSQLLIGKRRCTSRADGAICILCRDKSLHTRHVYWTLTSGYSGIRDGSSWDCTWIGSHILGQTVSDDAVLSEGTDIHEKHTSVV